MTRRHFLITVGALVFVLSAIFALFGWFGAEVGHAAAPVAPLEAAKTAEGAAQPESPNAPTLCNDGNYVITQSSGASIVPGTTDTGNHSDDVISTIVLPFIYTLYGQNYNAV